MNKSVRVILSIDGGGIRGILPIVYLMEIQRLLEKHPKQLNLSKVVDLVAGTSTGAVIGAALTFSKNGKAPLFMPDQLLNLYKERGKQVFDKERSQKHNEYPLKMLLEQSFGTIRLSDFSKYFLFVSYDLGGKRPFVFTSDDKKFRNIHLSKVLLACSAIKDYFPPVKIGTYQLIDGIETAKNPTKIAYEYARKYYPDDVILVVSIGTGIVSESIQDKIDKEAEAVHENMLSMVHNKSIEGSNATVYFRFQTKIHYANYDMDDTTPENLLNLYKDALIAVEKDAQNLNDLVRFIFEQRE
jgi:patatin-like phospholipase/acyl hydrolase